MLVLTKTLSISSLNQSQIVTVSNAFDAPIYNRLRL